jgi:hypothetical protein
MKQSSVKKSGIRYSLLGSAVAFLLATSCCWLPWLAVVLGGAAGLSSFAAGLESYSPAMMVLGAVFLGVAGWQFLQKKQANKSSMLLRSTITCPECGHLKEETMPTNACQYFYECENCKTLLRPKPGDCCVYCSYGSAPCPPVQEGNDCC